VQSVVDAMSEFDRTENIRRSIRRPKKSQAPAPPSDARPSPSEDVSSIIKRLLNTRRDFVATSPTPARPPQPRVVSATPKTPDDDSSRDFLLAIQRQINQIEFGQKTSEEQPVVALNPVRKTRYDEMESLLNTGISDLATNKHDTDDETDAIGFQRGGGTRSSVQGVPNTAAEVKKMKMPRPVARTASDTKQHEMLRGIFKKKEAAAEDASKVTSSGDAGGEIYGKRVVVEAGGDKVFFF
jgi:hypothetical protein